MSSDTLIPVEQKQVLFYEDELTAVRATDGYIYVSVRHLCDALGLDRRGQVQRIERNEILAEGYKGGGVMPPPSKQKGGGIQQVGLLRVDLVPLWLSGIDTNRVKEEIRPKLKQYQREVAKILWEAFQEGRLTSDPALDDLLATDSPAAQAYKTAVAILQIARQQLLLEAQLQAQANQLATHTNQLTEHERRLELVESTLSDNKRRITPEQASQLSQVVKAVAMALGKQTKKNEYGGVYGEMYRRFAIPSYKELPASRFDEAMQWLNEWLQTLNSTTPF